METHPKDLGRRPLTRLEDERVPAVVAYLDTELVTKLFAGGGTQGSS